MSLIIWTLGKESGRFFKVLVMLVTKVRNENPAKSNIYIVKSHQKKDFTDYR